MTFNNKTNRTPDEVIDPKAVAARSGAIKFGVVCFVLMAITNGTPIAGVFFLAGVIAFYVAYQTKTRRKKKGEVGVY